MDHIEGEGEGEMTPWQRPQLHKLTRVRVEVRLHPETAEALYAEADRRQQSLSATGEALIQEALQNAAKPTSTDFHQPG